MGLCLEKALLIEYDLATDTVGAGRMQVQFNPVSYSIQKTNQYDVDETVFGGAGGRSPPQFLRCEHLRLTAELLFDTYNPLLPFGTQVDVRTQFKKLGKGLVVKADKHTPPGLLFAWGTVAFVGVLTELSEEYTMFSRGGTPVRAKLAITMVGWLADEARMPNESPDRTKLRTVNQKDTLWSLAQEEYGSAAYWRVIALANGIENPRKLTDTARLILPALPGGEG